MANILAQLLSWIAGKIVIYAVILGLLLAFFLVTALPPLVAKYHQDELEKAIVELSHSKQLVGQLAERTTKISAEINDRSQQLQTLNDERRELEKWIEKVKNLFRRGEVERAKLQIETQRKLLTAEIRSLSETQRQLQLEGGENEEELKKRQLLRDEKEQQLQEVQALRQTFDSLMRDSLRDLSIKAALILGAIIIVPLLWRLAAFYLLAPLAQSANPILLGSDSPEAAEISATASHPAQRIILSLGEVMLTKVDYLQASMGNFSKRTTCLMDWHYPFSSIAAGLYLLTRITNTSEIPGQVTLSTQEDATEELATIAIPEGKSLVFRPHYLVALTHPQGRPPRIRSRWIFWKLHAWVNLQFRFLIIQGPVNLVLSAQRGLQVDSVTSDLPGRRVNSRLTAAFSPQLNYSPLRAETFISYLWGKNALFDDFFQGSGWVIQQQVTGNRKNPITRIWQNFFNLFGKVFGI